MRPSLSYLDERDARQKEVQRHTDDEDESGGEEELKAVQVQFKRRESERAQAARKRSHAYLQKQFEEDAWVPLAYHDEQVRGRGWRNGPRPRQALTPRTARPARRPPPLRQTPEADEVYGQLFAVAEDPIVLPTSRKEYLQALIPPPSTVEECGVAAPEQWAADGHSTRGACELMSAGSCRHRQLSSAAGVVSMHDLQNMNLDDRVRTLLQNSTAAPPAGRPGHGPGYSAKQTWRPHALAVDPRSATGAVFAAARPCPHRRHCGPPGRAQQARLPRPGQLGHPQVRRDRVTRLRPCRHSLSARLQRRQCRGRAQRGVLGRPDGALPGLPALPVLQGAHHFPPRVF